MYAFVSLQIWDKMFVPLHCLNFGIGGDQTQNVLWRLNNGELEGFAPKVPQCYSCRPRFYFSEICLKLLLLNTPDGSNAVQ